MTNPDPYPLYPPIIDESWDPTTIIMFLLLSLCNQQPYVPTRNLRSSSDFKVLTPIFNLRTGGERSFSFQAAKTWNQLPSF